MFHTIQPKILDRMRYLEQMDQKDRTDGTPRLERLRQIPAETGQFLAILAASAPEGEIIEIGTSAGYSTLWLALAARQTGRKITTYEVLPAKFQLSSETFQAAEVEDVVHLVQGDARQFLHQDRQIGFCFLDAEKEIYGDCYDLIVPSLVSGGILVADNSISHRDHLQQMLDRVFSDECVDAIIVPVGKGELVCRKI